MQSSLRYLVLGLLLLLPLSAAHAQAPTVSAIGDVTVNAGTTTTVNVVAVDVNGDPITLTTSAPDFVTINAPTTGSGVVVTTLTLTPGAAAVGTHSATVTATAAGQADSENFQITVNAAGSNRAPVVTAPALQIVTEGATLTFPVTAVDADGQAITFLSSSGLPSGATFTPGTLNASGTFTWTPSTTQAGEYDVTFTAANGLEGTATTHIRVLDSSTTGVSIGAINDVTVAAGSSTSVGVNVTGPSTGLITLTSSLPSFATITGSTSGTGSLTSSIQIAPGATVAPGTYPASVTATVGALTDTETFDIIVTAAGGGQVSIANINDVTVTVGNTVTRNVIVTGPTTGQISVTASLPSFATLNAPTSSSGTGTLLTSITVAPGLSVAPGTYHASVTATAGTQTDTESFDIVVLAAGGVNDAPVISAPSTISVNEGAMVTFTVSATDADDDEIDLSILNRPSGATFTDHGDGTATFRWTPSFAQSGIYTVVFRASDGEGGVDTHVTTITVVNVTGGGDAQARIRVNRRIKLHNDRVCFRIQPMNGFDLARVDLASLRLEFDGESIPSIASRTRLQMECEDEDDGGRRHSHNAGVGGDCDDDDDCDHDDDCDDCDDDHDDCDDDDDCDHDDDDDECDDDDGDEVCRAVGIRVCFSTSRLRDLFDCANFIDLNLLADARIVGDLLGGGDFIARFDIDFRGHARGMGFKIRPNPLNPKADVTFTLSRAGRVRVTIYDLQGRLVRTLLDENRPEGQHVVTWDGSDERKGRVASGVYFVKVRAPQGEEVQRATVLK